MMMRNVASWFVVRTASILVLLLCLGTDVHAAGICGNGVEEMSEECDPGGAKHVDGNPALASCTNGNDCFYDFSCCKFNCQYVGQGTPCTDDNDCTTDDKCDQVGRCTGPFVANDAPCDDGAFCNGADTCQIGECIGHAGDPCAANTDCTVTCDEGGDQCTATPFVPCADDGNTCTNDVCDGSAVCSHPALPAATVCRPQTTVCDVAEVCAGGGAPCPGDGLVPNGTPCGDQCTTAGTCQNGACASGTPIDCDDNDACNGLETCNSLTGCVPGQPLDCTDGDSCTGDLCAPIGGCSNPVLPDGSACDDGERCTLFDSCAAGTCVGADVQFVALKSARFGAQAVGYGHLAVNDATGSVKFSRGGRMEDGSLVTVNALRLSRDASVDDVETNDRRGPGVVRGTETTVSVPLGLSCTPASDDCADTTVHIVAERAVERLSPGVYGHVKVKRRGTLELDPGEYTFCSLKLGPPSAFRPRGDVTVRIKKNLTVSQAILEPYAGVAQIIVGGKTKIGVRSEVHRMAFSTPNGQFQLATKSKFDGAVCAQKIKGNFDVHFGCPLP